MFSSLSVGCCGNSSSGCILIFSHTSIICARVLSCGHLPVFLFFIATHSLQLCNGPLWGCKVRAFAAGFLIYMFPFLLFPLLLIGLLLLLFFFFPLSLHLLMKNVWAKPSLTGLKHQSSSKFLWFSKCVQCLLPFLLVQPYLLTNCLTVNVLENINHKRVSDAVVEIQCSSTLDACPTTATGIHFFYFFAFVFFCCRNFRMVK